MHKFFKGFNYAWKGLVIAWNEEINFRFDICFSVLVVVFGVAFNLAFWEWAFVVFMMGFVITVEVVNTALEELCNKFTREHDPHIAKIKDLSAGAVLASAICATVVGAIIFLPHIFTLFA
jgi:diacylglycerol kinase